MKQGKIHKPNIIHPLKTNMAYNRIDQAQEYIQEIKDLIENPIEIHITSDFDLNSLSKAKNYIKAFIQKQT